MLSFSKSSSNPYEPHRGVKSCWTSKFFSLTFPSDTDALPNFFLVYVQFPACVSLSTLLLEGLGGLSWGHPEYQINMVSLR